MGKITDEPYACGMSDEEKAAWIQNKIAYLEESNHQKCINVEEGVDDGYEFIKFYSEKEHMSTNPQTESTIYFKSESCDINK